MEIQTGTRPKRLKAETKMAKDLFLYGDGNGVRVLDLNELVEKSGCTMAAIRYWIKDWEAEYERAVKSSSPLANVRENSQINELSLFSVAEPVLTAHKSDSEFLRERLDKAKSELANLPQVIEKLEDILKAFSSDPEKFDEALQLFDRYLRMHANEKSLTKLVIDLKREWNANIGIDSLKSIQEAQGKAYAVAIAKSGVPEPEPTTKVVEETGVFERRG